MQWDLTQSGAQVSGEGGAFGHAGPFAGTISGNTLTFSFSVGMGGQGCGNSFTGTATVGDSSLTGTFSGRDCAGVSYNNGMMSWTLATGRSTRQSINIAGTWAGTLPNIIGGGTWVWRIPQANGDVNGGTASGSISVTNNSQQLGAGSFTATITNRFPGPSMTVTFSATFTGTCTGTMNVNSNLDQGGNVLGGGVGGNTCNGSFTAPGMFDIRRCGVGVDPRCP